MTAEIAILNKSAIALAADSAVTIGTGDHEEKTYDSADKLFELCRDNPIGIMIYNGLSFAETPLQSLIKRFRNSCGSFDSVKQAAFEFLNYLNDFGASSPDRVKLDSIRRLAAPIMQQISARFYEELQRKLIEPHAGDDVDWQTISREILDRNIALWERIYSRRDDAKFVGGGEFEVSPEIEQQLKQMVIDHAVGDDAQKARILAIIKLGLQKDLLSSGYTGIVIAGFGKKELFPTLLAFEIDGMVGGSLKYIVSNETDIDRDGPRAAVIPFAQREMVDRFLYGMDEQIERHLIQFSENTVTKVREAMIGRMEFESEEDGLSFKQAVQRAEEAFISGMKVDAFEEIRKNSRSEIESLIEFMPKPELAKMAEALVNLTSIKKRVSRGMDTVGGPIDVAVISEAEGFVWVKRKHYFTPDLNPRYIHRVGRGLHEEAVYAKSSNESSRERGKSSA
ncbi:hypothetical protein NML43_27295 [Rhodopseudomonas palustris]|uniref:hypothetical protein n=1 Tax=Rhodopseudomonas palustris TaxID=1076 RepID=UPI0020CC16DE|nr:hypothetical protein [Rhodopseudomonas palustris]MCP9630811.1 hypothetical protein [Rhodopseudomonas palustris]